MELYKHFKMYSMLRYITVILFIVSTTVKADITPSYDVPAEKLKFFDVEEKELVLVCQSSTKVIWTKNGTDIKNVPELKKQKDDDAIRYQIKDNQLIIRNLQIEDQGKYVCSNAETKESAEINVIANSYVKKIPENTSAVEGEKLKIHCKVFGTDPVITWEVAYDKGDGQWDFEPVNETRIGYLSADNVEHAILIVNSTVMEDRGWYNCTVQNRATEFNPTKYPKSTSGTFVRVKGKLAALWPFLGICAEVLILCAIILVYEKRRNKEGLDESDTDQSPEQEKLKTGK